VKTLLDSRARRSVDEPGWELVWWACRNHMITVERGEWDLPARVGDRDDMLGWVVMDGLVCREIRLRDRGLLELLGPGDVVQPTSVRDAPGLTDAPRLTTAVQTTLLVLGISLIRVSAKYPAALGLINRRLEAQRQRLATQALIAHLPRAEHRLLLQMWHLAERWGRETPEGTVLALPLTHDLLGHLAAARRSTSTLALRALEDDGLICRREDGTWLLTPAAEEQVRLLTPDNSASRLLGQTLRLRSTQVLEESRALRAEAEQLRRHRRSDRLR
jgi:DNA-binding transcriptional ArsR family regulator